MRSIGLARNLSRLDKQFSFNLTVKFMIDEVDFINACILLRIGAQGIIIVYDVTDRETFDNVRTWITEIEKYSQAGVCKILVGNKCDMEDRRQVTFEEGKEFAAQFGMPFLETSAKATQRVEEAFDTMTKEIKEKMMSKPGGGRGGTPGGPAFGQGKQLPQQ